jgi:hypothetical protein
MSFEEDESGFTWRCERCGLLAEFPPHSFWRGVDELKARGWQFSRDSEGGWGHLCAKCGRKRVAELLDRTGPRRFA